MKKPRTEEPIHLGGSLIRFPPDDRGPCPSRATAVLGVNEPTQVRCGKLAGHSGRHMFHIEWGDGTPDTLHALEAQQ